jgi:phosphoribosyl-dephospho-CoA transferase
MLRRHDLLRIRADGWPEILAGLPGLTDEPRRLVEGWAERGWPVIVRRPAPGDKEPNIPLGLPLPPSCGKLRLAFSVPPRLVAETVAGLSLSEAAAVAPAGWLAQVDDLLALGERLALRPAVFGALLWQCVTGLPYLHGGSDIDLLWPTPAAAALTDLLEGLERLDAAGPAPIDGEIALPAGGGANWRELRRELRAPGGTVLVKAMDGAEILCAQTLFA